MGVKISFNGAKVDGKVIIGNNVNINGDLDVSMDNAEVNGEVKVANESRIGGNLSASMDETTVNGGISVGNHTSIGGNVTTRVNVNGEVENVAILNDSFIGGSKETKVIVSRGGKMIKKEGLLAKIAKLFGGKKSSEHSREGYPQKNNKERNKGRNKQWRREDGTPYTTYNPSNNISIVDNKKRIVITVEKDLEQ